VWTVALAWTAAHTLPPAVAGAVLAVEMFPQAALVLLGGVIAEQGAGLAVVGVSWLPLVLLGMTTVGVTAGLASVWLSAAFLRAIDPAYTGRVSSVTSLGDMTLMPLSVPALGAVAAATSIVTATVAFGLCMSSLCLWFGTRRAIAVLT
jgi:hypothetical protein